MIFDSFFGNAMAHFFTIYKEKLYLHIILPAMATSLAQKFKIKEGFTLRTINAPADFKKQLGALPANVAITTSGKTFQQLHWFVLNKAQLDKELPRIMPLVKGDVLCWCYYPKGTSNIQTDLTRDKGW